MRKSRKRKAKQAETSRREKVMLRDSVMNQYFCSFNLYLHATKEQFLIALFAIANKFVLNIFCCVCLKEGSKCKRRDMNRSTVARGLGARALRFGALGLTVMA